jgi:hypothetical protein
LLSEQNNANINAKITLINRKHPLFKNYPFNRFQDMGYHYLILIRCFFSFNARPYQTFSLYFLQVKNEKAFDLKRKLKNWKFRLDPYESLKRKTYSIEIETVTLKRAKKVDFVTKK